MSNEKELKDAEALKVIMDSTCESICGILKEFRKALDTTKKREYLATVMLFTGIILKVLEQYHMDVNLDEFTQFLSHMRNEFKDLIEDENDEDCDDESCPCGNEGCEGIINVTRIDPRSEKGRDLMKEIIAHLERIHGKKKAE